MSLDAPIPAAPTPETPLLPPPLPALAPVEAPRDPEWRDLLLAVPLCWGAAIVVQVAAVVISMVRSGSADTTKLISPGFVAVSTALSAIATLTVVLLTIRGRCRKPIWQVLSPEPLTASRVFAGAGLGFGCALVAIVLMHFLSTGQSLMSELVRTRRGLAAITFVALLAPFEEEVYYRGLIFPALRSVWGVRWAVIAVAGWFGAVHAMQLAGDWIGLPIVTGMGFLWTYMRQRFGSIWPGVASHFTYNLTLTALSWITFSEQ